MAVPLLDPNQPLPFERNHIRSGPIERSGFDDYGVIFTSRQGVSPADFHPADLLGATLEVTELRDKGESNRFFTILGGYYCERISSGGQEKVDISHIFGVAADASKGFGLRPGDHCLVDDWEMKDLSGPPRSNMMDERKKGENGWTLIVNFKPSRSQYPFSGKSMEITRECPDLTSLTIVTTETTETHVTVQAQATLNHGPARGFTWNWGDNSPLEETNEPVATHQYPRPSGADQPFTIKVSTIGPDGCASEKTGEYVVPGICPVMHPGPSEVTYPNDTHAMAFVSLSGPHEDGMKYHWNWDDGSEIEETTVPNATHRYDRGTEQKLFKINASTIGPGTCGSDHDIPLPVDPRPCPVIKSFVASEGQ